MKKNVFLGAMITFVLTAATFMMNVLPVSACALMARNRRLPDMMK